MFKLQEGTGRFVRDVAVAVVAGVLLTYLGYRNVVGRPELRQVPDTRLDSVGPIRSAAKRQRQDTLIVPEGRTFGTMPGGLSVTVREVGGLYTGGPAFARITVGAPGVKSISDSYPVGGSFLYSVNSRHTSYDVRVTEIRRPNALAVIFLGLFRDFPPEVQFVITELPGRSQPSN